MSFDCSYEEDDCWLDLEVPETQKEREEWLEYQRYLADYIDDEEEADLR